MGCIGGIIAAIFGVVLIATISQAGAPAPFVLFGVVFIVLALLGSLYNFYNTTSKNRFSEYDITSEHEESDPIASALGHERPGPRNRKPRQNDLPRKIEGGFCPYCGTPVEPDFDYCPNCGKDI